MNLPELSIRRPVLAVMLSAVLVVFGVISYYKVGVQQQPNITFPVMTITTNLPGADPALVNQSVTKPVEKAVNTIAGIKHINSSSTAGKSSVVMQFNIGTDLNAAYNEVESKLNEIKDELPQGTKSPIITKASTTAEPIMLLALYGDRSILELDDYARNTIKEKIENVPGVGSVNIEGSGKQVVRVSLNLAKMAAMKITPEDVQSAFSAQHVQRPGGMISHGQRQYMLNLNLEFKSLKEMGDMIIAYREGAPIRLDSIATIKMDQESHQSFAQYNGKPTVGISIMKKSGANTVDISQAIQKRIKDNIAPRLPHGINIATVYEQSNYILSIIHGLEQDAWLSIIAAGLVIFLFLKNIRSTLIVITAIPVSLLGVVVAIYAFGYTFNMVTLLGIILLVGVVVDDAIVVLENIYRHGAELGQDRVTAAIAGSRQVFFAVMASTLTLVSIFVPVIFMGGIIGLFFKSFAVVVSVGVLVSLFVSITLTPMLCSKILSVKPNEQHGRLYKTFDAGFVALDKFYHGILKVCLNIRWLIVILAAVLVIVTIPVFGWVGKAFMPTSQDSGHFYINVQTPEGSSAAYTKGRIAAIESVLRKHSEVANYFASVGPATQGNITVRLVPYQDQQIKQSVLEPLIQNEMKKIPGVQAFVSTAGGTGGKSFTFQIQGANYKETVQWALRFLNAIQKQPELGSPYIFMAMNQPEYQVVLERALAKSVGISANSVANALMILGGGAKIAKFSKEGGDQRYSVLLHAEKGQFTKPDDVGHIYLRGPQNSLVRLDTVTSLITSVAPVKMTRTDLNYSIGFQTTPKISTDKAIKEVMKLAKQMLPKSMEVKLTGNAASLKATTERVSFAFVLIIVLMYMVLASQFNSFIQPLIVLVAQPLALVGGIIVLYLTGETLNIYSMIGMLLLMGLVAKNSILLIDLTNQLRAKGESIKDALMYACPLRMRPVIMTSLAIIFAMLPAALSSGPGSDAHRPLSLVIIGGMVSSTLLTLVVVPALYSLVENGLERLHKKPSATK